MSSHWSWPSAITRRVLLVPQSATNQCFPPRRGMRSGAHKVDRLCTWLLKPVPGFVKGLEAWTEPPPQAPSLEQSRRM